MKNNPNEKLQEYLGKLDIIEHLLEEMKKNPQEKEETLIMRETCITIHAFNAWIMEMSQKGVIFDSDRRSQVIEKATRVSSLLNT